MFVSPTEPAIVKALGTVSSFPEKIGADISFVAGQKLVGIQRKELGDFIASIADGRLAREIDLLTTRAQVSVLILEGRPAYTRDGSLLNTWGQQTWTKTQIRRLVLSIQDQGVWFIPTDNIEDTVTAILDIRAWAEKGSHHALSRRPNAPRGPWRERKIGEWLLQSFEGISDELASRIVKHFGGVPITWTVTPEELMRVPGIGPKRAKMLVESLQSANGYPTMAETKKGR